ncbi:amidohydrolase [uncultured Maribacter sp.]|uniref:amidohydrolase n=1 Tax=uncultured Maribacter sp. TaxID=431308 RepID=UPI00261C05A0|nr:amidohydrolase [uncultured Maribacter sp.]
MNVELNIALIQIPLEWEEPNLNRTLIQNKIEALKVDTDVVVLPEMFTTGFTMNPSSIAVNEGNKTIAWMQRVAYENNVAIVGSIVFSELNKNYNRLFFVTPNGEFWYYNKKHTFTLAGENKVYESGKDRLIINYKGFRFCPLICYDLRFPVWARNTENYDLLIYVANWPKPRVLAWDSLLKARAIENMAYCIGVNRIGTDNSGHQYSGHSAVYDCLGKTLAFSDKEEVLYATLSKTHLEKTRNKLKFLEDRDAFNLIQ